MKKLFVALMVVFLALCLASCGKDEPKQREEAGSKDGKQKEEEFTKETAEAFIAKFYTAMMIDRDFDVVYQSMIPEDKVDVISREYTSEYDDPASDFNLYKEMKEELAEVWEGPEVYTFKILACEEVTEAREVWRMYHDEIGDVPDSELKAMREDVLDRIKDADVTVPSGEPVYVATVRWSTYIDGEYYEEVKLVSVYQYKGKMYMGSIDLGDMF